MPKPKAKPAEPVSFVEAAFEKWWKDGRAVPGLMRKGKDIFRQAFIAGSNAAAPALVAPAPPPAPPPPPEIVHLYEPTEIVMVSMPGVVPVAGLAFKKVEEGKKRHVRLWDEKHERLEDDPALYPVSCIAPIEDRAWPVVHDIRAYVKAERAKKS